MSDNSSASNEVDSRTVESLSSLVNSSLMAFFSRWALGHVVFSKRMPRSWPLQRETLSANIESYRWRTI
jgi:hypothetical protein